MPLDSVEFALNPEPRCPCVLLLDISGSMAGEPINKLNDGLKTFQQNLLQDDIASKRVEVAIVTFEDSVQVVQDFVTAESFRPPTLTAGGSTCMGAGILKALDIVQDRKATYKQNSITYYRPWVFMITDGGPTDSYQEAARRVESDETAKRVAFFAVGVQGADMGTLKTIASRAPLKLDGLNFAEMFVWLSASMQQVSNSDPGNQQQVALPPPGWGTV